MWAKVVRTGSPSLTDLEDEKSQNPSRSFHLFHDMQLHLYRPFIALKGCWWIFHDFSLFLKEENWIFAKSLAEEVKVAGWISMDILETLDESDATSSPVLLGLRMAILTKPGASSHFFPQLPVCENMLLEVQQSQHSSFLLSQKLKKKSPSSGMDRVKIVASHIHDTHH